MKKYTIVAVPVDEVGFSSLDFYGTSGTGLDVGDLCEFEGVDIADVEGANTLEEDLVNSYGEGQLLRLLITESN